MKQRTRASQRGKRRGAIYGAVRVLSTFVSKEDLLEVCWDLSTTAERASSEHLREESFEAYCERRSKAALEVLIDAFESRRRESGRSLIGQPELSRVRAALLDDLQKERALLRAVLEKEACRCPACRKGGAS